MLSQVLIEAEKDPTCLIGGRLPLIESHGRAGKSDIFVCEACEYKNHYHELSPDTAMSEEECRAHLQALLASIPTKKARIACLSFFKTLSHTGQGFILRVPRKIISLGRAFRGQRPLSASHCYFATFAQLSFRPTVRL